MSVYLFGNIIILAMDKVSAIPNIFFVLGMNLNHHNNNKEYRADIPTQSKRNTFPKRFSKSIFLLTQTFSYKNSMYCYMTIVA